MSDKMTLDQQPVESLNYEIKKCKLEATKNQKKKTKSEFNSA